MLQANATSVAKLDQIVDHFKENFKFNKAQTVCTFCNATKSYFHLSQRTVIEAARSAIFNPCKRKYEKMYLRVKVSGDFFSMHLWLIL